jgi:chromosome segregation ATPase
MEVFIMSAVWEAIRAIRLAKADVEDDLLPLEGVRQAFNEIDSRWKELVTLFPSKDWHPIKEIEDCLNRLREELESGGAGLPQESELPAEIRPLAPEILWWRRVHGVEACFHNIKLFAGKMLNAIRSAQGEEGGVTQRVVQLLEEIISECEKILPPLRERRKVAREAVDRKKEAMKPKKTPEERLKEALDKVERKLGALYYGFEEVDERADKVKEAFKWLRTLVEKKSRNIEDIRSAMRELAVAWHEYAMKAPLPSGTFGPFPPRNRVVDEMNDAINELYDILRETVLSRSES